MNSRLLILLCVAAILPTAFPRLLYSQDEEKFTPLTIEQVGIWCNRQNLAFDRDDKASRITIEKVGSNNLRFIYLFDTKRETMAILVPVVSNASVSNGKLAEAANRINQVLSAGAFVVRQDGAMVFRIGILSKGTHVSQKGIDNYFRIALGTVDQVYRNLQKVAAGEIEPSKVLDAAGN